MKENQLEKITEDLIIEGNNLRGFFNVWWTLNREHMNHADTINHKEYYHFFQVVRFTCNRNIYLSIGKIFDKDGRTSSLNSLKTILEEEGKTEMVALSDQVVTSIN